MLDIKNLERRWFKYKLKSFFPYLAMLVLSISLLVGIALWINSKKTEHQIVPQQQKVLLSKNTTNPSRSVAENNVTFIEPSMEFVQSFQNTQSTPDSSIPIPHPITNAKSVQPVINASIPTPKTMTIPEYSPPLATMPALSKTSSNKSLSINRDESKLDINTLERRFKETSNANLGLFIARYYYDHGDYNEAYNYALKTNNTNDKIDESWI
ncbi:MAG: hypothetical protein PHW73_05755, partial [Atribacterota bacterium]|nr:hypothetical protein [Atribacterota bacterium]